MIAFLPHQIISNLNTGSWRGLATVNIKSHNLNQYLQQVKEGVRVQRMKEAIRHPANH